MFLFGKRTTSQQQLQPIEKTPIVRTISDPLHPTGKTSSKAQQFLQALMQTPRNKANITSPREDVINTRERKTSFLHIKEKFEEKVQFPPRRELMELCTYQFAMTDINCKFYFKMCLDFQKCGEMLSYLDGVKEFKKKKDTMERRKYALSVIQNYLLIGSKRELNITKNEKIGIAIKFEKLPEDDIPLDFFDEVDNAVHFQLRSEAYPKFIDSKEFKEYFTRFRAKDFKTNTKPEKPKEMIEVVAVKCEDGPEITIEKNDDKIQQNIQCSEASLETSECQMNKL